MIYSQVAICYHLLTDPEIKVEKSGASVSSGKKMISITLEDGVPVLQLANEYGNSLSYSLTGGGQFETLHAELWRFVKESQH